MVHSRLIVIVLSGDIMVGGPTLIYQESILKMHLKAKMLQLFWSLGHIEKDFQEVTSSSLIKANADVDISLAS